MSIFTQRTAARLALAQIDATKCARPGCGHPLSSHLVQIRPNGDPCRGYELIEHKSGDPNKAKVKNCSCKRFVEAAERLAV